MASPGDSTMLGNNYIYSLYEDDRRNLWIGTYEGIYIYNFETEQFGFFSLRTPDSIVIRSHVSGIEEDKRRNVWISTLSQGVFRYDRDKNALYNYTYCLDSVNAGDMNVLPALCIDHDNTVWVAPRNNDGNVMRYDRINDRFVALPLQTATGRLNDNVCVMLEDSGHNFWIGAWEHGLCKMDRNTGTVEPFLLPRSANGILHVHEITEYQPHTLLVGSDDGLSVFDTRTCESSLITVSEFKSSTLSDKFVYPIYRDSEGGLWVGTYYGGVNYSPPSKGEITGYSYTSHANSVGGNIISCFCEDDGGNIWIGTDDGGLSRFDPLKNTFKRYMPGKSRNSLSYHNIHALCYDDGKIWIGTYSGGLNVLDLKTGRFKHYYSVGSDPFSAQAISSVYSILKDGNDIWIGTMNDICLYNPQKDNFIRMKHTGITTVDMANDTDGNIWFATWGGGLFCYCKKRCEWRHYLHDPSNSASIPHNQINSLHVDSGGKLWLGTSNGLCSYCRENDAFTVIPLDILSNQIYYVRNINGVVWMTTNNGLVSYVAKDSAVRSFFKNDGLQSDQFNIKAGLLCSSGLLYLGTINGFNVVNPRNLLQNTDIPPVYITNFQVFNKDIKIDRHGLLRQSLLYAGQIELPHKANVFSMEYVALSYSAPSKNQYKYMLEGFDKDWNIVKNQRKAIYTNLPPGRYVFRVTGCNNDGVWNSQGACLTIIVHPPFWLTVQAYALYILLIVATLMYTVRIIIRQEARKHKKRIRQLHQEKEKELYDAKINFFTLVAHEIRTPVSLIIGPLEKIMDNIHSLSGNVQDSLQIISRNSQRLLSLVNQLLDFRKAEENAFVISPAPHNIHGLLQNICIRFEPVAEQMNIAFALEMDDKTVTAMIDAEVFTKIVSNLLTNALKFTNDVIKISVASDNERVFIKVADNGEGIAKENIEAIFQPFVQVTKNYRQGTGIGLSLVKLLVDAHHGEIKVESIPYRETAFTVILPYLHGDEQQRCDETLQMSEEKHTDKPALLIVEDDAGMRKFLHEYLSAGYRIIEATNGKEGLALLEKQSVDIIISDIMMPVMDGIAFTRKLKENLKFSHIPVILLTARIDKNSKVEGIKTGADAYVEKPFSPQMLAAQIQNLVESRKKLRKKFSEMPFVPISSVAGNKADEQFLNKINVIIDRNINNQDFSVDMLAKEAGISRSGLFAKIKLLIDMTPNELIQLIRLKKAAQLLSSREYRINEICYLVGFNNPSYFSKCFQKQFGVLPKDFISQ
jgi:signal transduction histidine kinase/ligand-binding sensor domain-containing protein/DNA-binding response OmpR family regulator